MALNPLSLEQINKVSPCRVEEVSNGVYVFHTKGGVVYSVSFKEDMEIRVIYRTMELENLGN